MNNRKKRCSNPACRRVFAYAPGQMIACPWCGTSSERDGGWQGSVAIGPFRFGVDAVPARLAEKNRYDVRLERMATGKKLLAIKTYRNAMQMAGAAPGLKEAKNLIDSVGSGEPHTLSNLTAGQVLLLMREGQMDLRVRRVWGRKG